MNWTTEAPKQDGWYWWRRDEMDPPEVVQLQRGTVMWAGDDVGTMAGGISGEFLGPLDPSQVLAYESLVKELHLTRLALDEEVRPQGECVWHSLGEGWHKADCRPAGQEEWSYNEDWTVCPYCAKRIKSVP